MAYEGGYAPQPPGQRPYNGPVMPRQPPQRQYGPNSGPMNQGGGGGRPNGAGPQQFDQYQDNYGHRGGGGGGGQYNDAYGYGGGQQPPPQGYPGRGRPPMPGGGRGGPPLNSGQGQYPPRGNGGPPNGPPTASPNGPPNGPPGRPPLSPEDTGFGNSAFPPFPGQDRRPDRYDEQKIMEGVADMSISGGNRPGPTMRGHPRGGSEGGGYGPPQRAYTQQGGFQEQPRRGPGPGSGMGPDNGYTGDDFGMPPRTMTMPSMMDPMQRQPPGRGNFVPYNGGFGGPGGPGDPAGPGGRGMAPPRPSTAQGYRPPPQRMYPGGPGPAPMGMGGGGYDNGNNGMGPGPNPNAGFGTAYGGGGYGSNYNYASSQQQDSSSQPSSLDDLYDAYYVPHEGDEYQQTAEQAQQPQPPQRGPDRFPELNKTKSQPDLRQPQRGVFEMAGDAPPMPLMGGGGGFNQFPPGRGPAPPMGQGGLPNGPMPGRQGSGASQRSGPPGPNGEGIMPVHPTPVRPGLMANSFASQQMNSHPAPVRSYNNQSSGMPPSSTQTPAPGARPQGPPGPLPEASNGGPRTSQPAAAAPEEPPVTPELLERLRNTVKANPADQATTLTLAKKLMEAIDVLVPSLPDPRTRNKARERYAMDAQKMLKKLANGQNSEAMFILADCLGRGAFGGEPDNKEAFTLYQSAAKLNHAAAAYRTAVCCEIGSEEGGGTRKDPLKAIQWYKRAATLGDTPAMYKVGMILLKGLLGQPQNPREAVNWLKRAADRADAENPHALHELGLLYESAQTNEVIVRDEAYSAQLFQQAADLGYKFSQYRIGCNYEFGLMGFPVDSRLSIMWYSKAAAQEEHQSELALSRWYLTGAEGVLQQNDTETYLWARKAAMAGLAKAEYAMGYFTEVGIGIPANLEDAKRWYWRAAAQDFPKARERLEELKRSGRTGPRQRERITRNNVTQQQEADCVVM